jgi:Asp-tRNA(Asn)/Glu-tRNA(Gln) amidotransferase B subunit
MVCKEQEKILNYLIGKVIKLSDRRADPKIVKNILLELLT